MNNYETTITVHDYTNDFLIFNEILKQTNKKNIYVDKILHSLLHDDVKTNVNVLN